MLTWAQRTIRQAAERAKVDGCNLNVTLQQTGLSEERLALWGGFKTLDISGRHKRREQLVRMLREEAAVNLGDEAIQGACDRPDANGYVKNPSDPSSYRSAKDILNKHWGLEKTDKQLRRVLKEHPEIRRWRPKAQRLSIHISDWFAHLDKEKGHISDDGWVPDPAEIERQKMEILRSKSPK